jgi:hypothetical protein
MKVLCVALALALILTFAPPRGLPDAAACSCMGFSAEAVPRKLEFSDAMIVGRVVNVETVDELRNKVHARVAVERVYSGRVRPTVKVETFDDSMCGYPVAPGERHFFALVKTDDGPYRTGMCIAFPMAGTGYPPMDASFDEFLQELERTRGSLRFARPSDPDRTTGLVVAATVLVVVAAGVVIILDQGRRRRA